MKKPVTGAIEFRTCPDDGRRRAHVLQTDGTWIRADLCHGCKFDYDAGWEYSLDCPIDRHAIAARMRELASTG